MDSDKSNLYTGSIDAYLIYYYKFSLMYQQNQKIKQNQQNQKINIENKTLNYKLHIPRVKVNVKLQVIDEE
jgi:hypothetical protein